MGCATSSVSPHGSAAGVGRAENGGAGGDDRKSSAPTSNGHGNAEPPPNRNQGVNGSAAADGTLHKSNGTTSPIPKGTSFEVRVAGDEESIIKRHPPKRLLKLEALEKPQLTAEELAEKLRAADEKRQKTLETRAKTASASRRSSKRARELLAAKEFEKQQQQTEEIGKKQASADKQREIQLMLNAERLRVREEKARLALERRKRLERDEEIVDYELEKDENFNERDDAHWSGTDDLSPSYELTGDNVYMGRDSPRKGVREQRSLEPRHSASTVDSCDTDYKRTRASVAAQAALRFTNGSIHNGNDYDDDAGFFD